MFSGIQLVDQDSNSTGVAFVIPNALLSRMTLGYHVKSTDTGGQRACLSRVPQALSFRLVCATSLASKAAKRKDLSATKLARVIYHMNVETHCVLKIRKAVLSLNQLMILLQSLQYILVQFQTKRNKLMLMKTYFLKNDCK